MDQPQEPATVIQPPATAEPPAAPLLAAPSAAPSAASVLAAHPGLGGALDRLVQRAVLSRVQADAVLAEVAAVPGPAQAGRRRILAEIAGYLGAAFVVGAAMLYLGQEWEPLGRGGRFGVLAAMTVVLAVGGLLTRLRDRAEGMRWWHGRPTDEVRRRLASTLFTGAAIAAGFATFVLLQSPSETYDGDADNRAWLVASLVALFAMAAGYLATRSTVGQLGAAGAALTVVTSSLTLLNFDDAGAYGVGILLLGVGWAVALWSGLFAERRFALGVAVTLALVGAQITVLGESVEWLGYLLTAAVAAVCFAAYARARDWVLLAGGVVGATLVVPEFLYDVSDGSLGAAGVMLVAGVTLLAASLVGLQIRRTPPEPPESVEPAAG